jgi:hypothetical protein
MKDSEVSAAPEKMKSSVLCFIIGKKSNFNNWSTESRKGWKMMGRKPRIYYPEAFYHIINRGNQRPKIYWDCADYEQMLEKLQEVPGEIAQIKGILFGR